MKVRPRTIEAVVAQTRADRVLEKALRDWHQRKAYLSVRVRDEPFDVWLRKIIRQLAGKLGIVMKPFNPDPSALVLALRLNALGDPRARDEAQKAEADGFETDINCYVEDGVVNSNLWLKCVDSAQTQTRADSVRSRWAQAGYDVHVWCDPEDVGAVVIDATIDFPIYANLVTCQKILDES